MAGTLVLCATPIGNLGDAPPRLREALESADVVYAEDTRRSRVLLRSLGVDRRLRSYFAGNEEARAAELKSQLSEGMTVALITDAGMPGISDPGFSAVQAAVAVEALVTVVPGPSAVTAALAVSGLATDRFSFEGFLPRKQAARRRRLDAVAQDERTIVLFAAPGRLVEDLRDLAAVLGLERSVVVARELTKLHEEVWRGTLGEAVVAWEERTRRGEFTLVVGGAPPPEEDLGAAVALVQERRRAGMTLGDAVREVAAETGTRRRRLYEAALRVDE